VRVRGRSRGVRRDHGRGDSHQPGHDHLIRDTFDFAAGEIARALGDEVTWRPGHAEETTVYAVYGRGFELVQRGEIRINSHKPEIMIRSDDLPSEPLKGMRVEVRGMMFEVATPQLDVEGVSYTLVLKKAS
jgi:hypothetical protein